MTAYYRIAERIICVASLFEEVHQFLYAYRTEGQQIDFFVAITLSDIAFERERSEAERQIEGLSPHHFSDPYLETLAVYRKIAEKMLDYGVVLFHGSCIAAGLPAIRQGCDGKDIGTNRQALVFCGSVEDAVQYGY